MERGRPARNQPTRLATWKSPTLTASDRRTRGPRSRPRSSAPTPGTDRSRRTHPAAASPAHSSSRAATVATARTVRCRWASTANRCQSQVGTSSSRAGSAGSHSRELGRTGRPFAVAAGQLTPGPERLLAGHPLLQAGRHQRIQDPAGCGSAGRPAAGGEPQRATGGRTYPAATSRRTPRSDPAPRPAASPRPAPRPRPAPAPGLGPQRQRAGAVRGPGGPPEPAADEPANRITGAVTQPPSVRRRSSGRRSGQRCSLAAAGTVVVGGRRIGIAQASRRTGSSRRRARTPGQIRMPCRSSNPAPSWRGRRSPLRPARCPSPTTASRPTMLSRTTAPAPIRTPSSSTEPSTTAPAADLAAGADGRAAGHLGRRVHLAAGQHQRLADRPGSASDGAIPLTRSADPATKSDGLPRSRQ